MKGFITLVVEENLSDVGNVGESIPVVAVLNADGCGC